MFSSRLLNIGRRPINHAAAHKLMGKTFRRVPFERDFGAKRLQLRLGDGGDAYAQEGKEDG